MAKTYSNEMTAELAGNHVIASVANGRLRRRRATVDLAAQASGDQIGLCAIGEGEYFVCGFLTASATLGTATLKIGTADDDDLYRPAAVFTDADTPTPFGTAAAKKDPAPKGGVEVVATVGTAALPASGVLIADIITAGV